MEGRAGQNKRDVQGKQAKELKSRQRWRLLQMNQATSVSLSDSLFPTPTQGSSAVTTVHTSSASVSSPAGATAHGMVHGTQGMERLVAFGSCGWGGRGEGGNGCERHGTGCSHGQPWLIDICGSKWRWRRQMQVGPAHAQATTDQA